MTEYEIFIPRASFNEISILHLSDFHLDGENLKIEKALREKAANKKYDFIFITGDLIDDDRGIAPLIKYLSLLESRYGLFCVWGNHDKFELKFRHIFTCNHKTKASDLPARDLRKLTEKLLGLNIRILLNEIEAVDVGDDRVFIFGVDNWFGIDRLQNWQKYEAKIIELKETLHSLPGNSCKILLTHVPDVVEIFSECGIDIIFSGHTHGGQIRIPFVGPLVAWSRFQRKYSRGIYKYNRSYLHVSPGLGVSRCTPFRFMCPPEITVIKIKGHS